MRYGLLPVFYVTAVIGAALACFGPWGIALAGIVLAVWSIVFAGKSHAGTLFAINAILVLGLLLLLCSGLLLPAVNSAREAAWRMQCSNNQRQVAMALLFYHETYGSFPPAYVADQQGRPMHSWRVLILPFLDYHDLYERYDFTEPWDGPNNRLLASQAPVYYRCPEDLSSQPLGETSYVVVVGPDTAWPGAIPRKIDDLTDGASHTLLFVEEPDLGIHWMEPRDLTVDKFLARHTSDDGPPECVAHRHDAFFSYTCSWNAMFADGRHMRMPEPSPRDALQAMLSINGGETVDDPYDFGEPRRYWRWGKIVAVCCFLLLAILPVFWLPGHLKRCEMRAEETMPADNADDRSAGPSLQDYGSIELS